MKCEYCGNEVDVSSEKCAHCGAPISKNNDVKPGIEKSSVINRPENVQVTNIPTTNNKKKKKKVIPIVIGLIVLLVLAIGSWLIFFNSSESNENVKDTFKTAANNMKKLDNYTMDLSVNMSMSYNGMNGSLDITGTGKIDEKNKTYSMNFNFLGQEMEMYGKTDGDKTTIYQYDNYDEKWSSSESDVSMLSTDNVSDTILDSYDIKKVKSDVNGLKKYEVSIDFNKLSKLALTSELEDEYNLDSGSIPDKITMYVYINSDNYIEKIYIDLLDLMKNIDLGDTGYKFDDLSVSITFSKFNTTGSITIPSDVIESANSNDKIVSDKEDEIEYDEEDIMYDVALSSSVYCKDTTIDFSNYNGELDDYLYLDKYDINSITEGIIAISEDCDIVIQKDFIINGKTCTYDDENYESCK